MLKISKLLAVSLLATSLLVGSQKLEAGFGIGVGIGVSGPGAYYSNNGYYNGYYGYSPYYDYYSYPGYYTSYPYPTDFYYYNNGYYMNNNYTNGYAYDYMGSSLVSKMQSDKTSRTLFLENGMTFRISAGTFDWTGYNISIYRSAYTRGNNNYVLVVNNNQFRAQRVESPAPGTVPQVQQPSQAQFTNPPNP
jgi:hypothetical protein